MIKTLVIAMASLAAIAGTASAYAQPGPAPGYDVSSRDPFWKDAPTDPYKRADFLQIHVERSRTEGRLSPALAESALNELRSVRREIAEVEHRDHGFTPADHSYIEGRLNHVRSTLP